MKISTFTHPLRDAGILALKFFLFVFSGINSEIGYQKMVKLYCLTNGYSNSILSSIIWLIKKLKKENLGLRNLDCKTSTLDWKDNLNAIVAKLRKDGYVVLRT